MSIEVKVPSMGESIVEVTVSRLLKEEGSFVETGEEIIELETEKLNQTLQAPQAGTIAWKVKPQETVKIEQVLGTITPSKAPPKEEKKQEKAPPQEKEAPSPLPPTPSLPKARISIEEALQSHTLSPSSPSSPSPSSPARSGERREPMSKLRKVISQKLVAVKNETAMLSTFNEVDMTQIQELRKQEKETFQKKHQVKLGLMSFFVHATVKALKEFPALNARIEGEEIVFSDPIHMGIAVGTDKGLLVPVLRNAENKSFAEIEKEILSLSEKAKQGTLPFDALQGGTFTITNGGVYGSLLSTPILNPPQSGILGMHNIVPRAVVIEGSIVARPMMYLALSYDHRIVDGKESVSFLISIKKNLESPTRLLLDL